MRCAGSLHIFLMCEVVHQIYRSIYYCLTMENDWNNVYSYPSLPSGNMGGVKVYSAS